MRESNELITAEQVRRKIGPLLRNLAGLWPLLILLAMLATSVVFIGCLFVRESNAYGPLQAAARNGNTLEVSRLISAKVDVNQRCDWKQWTALHAAAVNGRVKVVEMLLNAGAKPNLVDDDGRTALHLTGCHYNRFAPYERRTYADHIAIAKLLLDHGAKVNATDNSKYTPLHCAAVGDNADLVDLLIRQGANPAAVSEQGSTPASLVALFHRTEHERVAAVLAGSLQNPATTRPHR